MINPLVSIIVPIYKVEKYIEKCAHSLMTQTYDNIEYIFIDDASPDDSVIKLLEVIKQYPNRQHAVQIIKHDVNKGLPDARNTGLASCNGDYIFHCDSDDWVEINMIEDMINHGKGADIVYTDFYLTFNQSSRYMKQPVASDTHDCVSLMLQGAMKYNVWNKLIKTSLYKDNMVSFPEGKGMGEDMTIVKLFVHAKIVTYIPMAYYHYMQINNDAFTKTYSQEHLDNVLYNANDLEAYLRRERLGELFNQDFQFFKLNLKLPFLITENTKMYAVWRNWFPEANRYISLNPSFSLRIKILQYLAIWKQDWLVYFYNIVLLRIIYGMYYK